MERRDVRRMRVRDKENVASQALWAWCYIFFRTVDWYFRETNLVGVAVGDRAWKGVRDAGGAGGGGPKGNDGSGGDCGSDVGGEGAPLLHLFVEGGVGLGAVAVKDECHLIVGGVA